MSFVREYKVKSTDGTELNVKMHGNKDGIPILFIHGMFQSQQCWSQLCEHSDLEQYCLITYDLRGHGDSGKPESIKAFIDRGIWADDVHAIVGEYDCFFIVAWSYGGYVVCDYINKYGDSKILGVNFVGAAIQLTRTFDMIGSGLLDEVSDMMSNNQNIVVESTGKFIRNCFDDQKSDENIERIIVESMKVPQVARKGLMMRRIDNQALLKTICVPVLFSHGQNDKVILIEMSNFASNAVDKSVLSVYEHTGHSLFIEQKDRFVKELIQFINDNNNSS